MGRGVYRAENQTSEKGYCLAAIGASGTHRKLPEPEPQRGGAGHLELVSLQGDHEVGYRYTEQSSRIHH